VHARTSLYIIHYVRMNEKCICEVYTSGKRPGVANDLFDYAKPNTLSWTAFISSQREV
jgi:hypothetical protein